MFKKLVLGITLAALLLAGCAEGEQPADVEQPDAPIETETPEANS